MEKYNFGTCLWIKVPVSHPWNKLRQESPLIGTQFPLHVTLQTNTTTFRIPHKMGIFNLGSHIQQIQSEQLRGKFYSLQIPVIIKNFSISNPHLSIAYKDNEPFSTSDIELAEILLRQMKKINSCNGEFIYKNCSEDFITW